MISRDEAQNRNYAAFRNAFGSDEEMLLSVTHPSLLAPEGLRFLDELTKEIGGFGGVRRVYSLTNASHAVPSTVGAENEPLVPRPFNVPGVSQRVLSALDDNPKLASLLISRDRRTAGITIEIDDRAGADTSKSGVIDALRGLMARRAGEAELHLSGIAVPKHDVAEFVRRDKTFLVPLSMLVLATMLAITFRHFSGVLIPMAVKVVSVIWPMGAYAMAGYRLNPITALLPPLIIVLSISTSVHLYDGWLQVPEGSGDRSCPLPGRHHGDDADPEQYRPGSFSETGGPALQGYPFHRPEPGGGVRPGIHGLPERRATVDRAGGHASLGSIAGRRRRGRSRGICLNRCFSPNPQAAGNHRNLLEPRF
jgi:hypothetical protein